MTDSLPISDLNSSTEMVQQLVLCDRSLAIYSRSSTQFAISQHTLTLRALKSSSSSLRTSITSKQCGLLCGQKYLWQLTDSITSSYHVSSLNTLVLLTVLISRSRSSIPSQVQFTSFEMKMCLKEGVCFGVCCWKYLPSDFVVRIESRLFRILLERLGKLSLPQVLLISVKRVRFILAEFRLQGCISIQPQVVGSWSKIVGAFYIRLDSSTRVFPSRRSFHLKQQLSKQNTLTTRQTLKMKIRIDCVMFILIIQGKGDLSSHNLYNFNKHMLTDIQTSIFGKKIFFATKQLLTV